MNVLSLKKFFLFIWTGFLLSNLCLAGPHIFSKYCKALSGMQVNRFSQALELIICQPSIYELLLAHYDIFSYMPSKSRYDSIINTKYEDIKSFFRKHYRSFSAYANNSVLPHLIKISPIDDCINYLLKYYFYTEVRYIVTQTVINDDFKDLELKNRLITLAKQKGRIREEEVHTLAPQDLSKILMDVAVKQGMVKTVIRKECTEEEIQKILLDILVKRQLTTTLIPQELVTALNKIFRSFAHLCLLCERCGCSNIHQSLRILLAYKSYGTIFNDIQPCLKEGMIHENRPELFDTIKEFMEQREELKILFMDIFKLKNEWIANKAFRHLFKFLL